MTLGKPRRTGPLRGRPLTLGSLFAAFWPRILGTWAMTLMEIALFALIPLLIGRAIDGLTGGDTAAFVQLAVALAVLILLGTLRRVFDTRAYGVMRVELGKDLARRSSDLPVSRLSARLGMGRELVDFLETELPEAMTALFRTFAAVVILFGFHPALAGTAAAAALVTLTIYGLAHGRFYRLNRALNEEAERQVQVLEGRSIPRLGAHLLALRRCEIRVSDTEGLVYGLIFTALLGSVLFNLWFATREIEITAGRVFSIVTYSWDFVEGALILPATLQSLSRLSEVTARINTPGNIR